MKVQSYARQLADELAEELELWGPEPGQPQIGWDDQEHQVCWGRADADTYSWLCRCGESGGFIPSAGTAALRASEHLAEIEQESETP